MRLAWGSDNAESSASVSAGRSGMEKQTIQDGGNGTSGVYLCYLDELNNDVSTAGTPTSRSPTLARRTIRYGSLSHSWGRQLGQVEEPLLDAGNRRRPTTVLIPPPVVPVVSESPVTVHGTQRSIVQPCRYRRQ